MLLKRITAILVVFILLFSTFSFGVLADTVDLPADLTDNDISTNSVVRTLTFPSSDNQHLYIIFWDTPEDFTIKNEAGQTAKFKCNYLHQLIKLPTEFINTAFTLTFSKNVRVSEVTSFIELPVEGVQDWQENESVCDLMIISTHADDEQLFFAGVLPLYATDGKTAVQVVYFTDHSDNILRRHELLDGLWEVGVTRYPIISNFPDAYSKTYEDALKNLEKAGYTETDALKFHVEQIRKFKPLVILGHDLKGEYGHGQHILNSTLLTRAVELAANSEEFSELPYIAYDTPKLYLHLYEENQIELELDTPVTTEQERFKDKTPFEISKLGFAKHTTQQGTWFKTWLNGKNGEITKSTQITTHSPRKFGLYRTTVGEDVLKTDIFENVTRRTPVIAETELDGEKEDKTNTEETTVSPDAEKKAVGKKLLYVSAACVLLIIIFLLGPQIIYLFRRVRPRN